MPIDLQQIKSASYCRNQTLELRAEDVSGDELTFSFSSEEPVLRWWGIEVLSHEKGCANLDRLNDRGAWLFNHNRNILLGSSLKAWLEEDKRAYVTVKWSNRDDVKGYRQDCEDGHLTHVSFAYDVLEVVETKGSDTYLVTSWECFEVSLVTIPADPSVGIGRSREACAPSSGDRPIILGADKPIILGATPSARNHSINSGGNMPTASRVAKEQERDRIRAIQILAERHRCEDLGEQAIEEDTPIELFRLQVLERMSPPQQPIARPPETFNGMLGLSGKEQKSYSLLKAIRAQVSGDWGDAGFERECDKTLRGQGFRSDGLLVPLEALGRSDRASYVTSTPATAGVLVGTDHHDESFVQALRSRTILDKLGIMRMDGLTGNVEIPRQTSVSSLGWVAEDTDLPEATPNFDAISLNPKTVGAWCQLSRLIATQSEPALEQLIRNDFALSLARELDRTGLHGSGTGNEPRGILNTPGIGSLSLGVNGGAPNWEAIVRLEGIVAGKNADEGDMGYVTSSAVRGKLKTTLKAAAAGSDFVWSDSAQAEGMGMLNGYKAFSSQTVRSDLTKGTGTNLSAIVFGNWSSFIIATWGALSLETDPYADFRKGRIAVRVMLFADMSVRNAESFAAITDVLTT
jgi:HK97 family phage major capsid protein/HK97 family phage prohead protease